MPTPLIAGLKAQAGRDFHNPGTIRTVQHILLFAEDLISVRQSKEVQGADRVFANLRAYIRKIDNPLRIQRQWETVRRWLHLKYRSFASLSSDHIGEVSLVFMEAVRELERFPADCE